MTRRAADDAITSRLTEARFCAARARQHGWCIGDRGLGELDAGDDLVVEELRARLPRDDRAADLELGSQPSPCEMLLQGRSEAGQRRGLE